MDYGTVLTLLIVTFSSVTSQIINVRKQGLCAKEKGNCTLISECQYARKLLEDYKFNQLEAGKRIRQMVCGYDSRNSPMVCCPNASSNHAIVYDKSEETATSRPKPTPSTEPPELVKTTEAPIMLIAKDISVKTTEAPIVSIAEDVSPVTESPAIFDPFPDRRVCGQVTGSDRIIGGSVTAPDEFPWTARIKYAAINDPSKGKSKSTYICTASLITDRHLVTAAHCFFSIKFQAVSVQLGVWSTETDCHEGGDLQCPPPPLEVDIEQVVKHHRFDRRNIAYGDIAVIKLKEPVNFTDFIQPICLPTTEYVRMQDYVRESSYWTAGWGFTEFGQPSVIKRKVNLEAVPIDICRAALPFIPETSSDSLICAGGREFKDSCKGDSGGPLMREVAEDYGVNWFLYGVTSFGTLDCGKAGVPGAYTRVTAYMDWIRQVVTALPESTRR